MIGHLQTLRKSIRFPESLDKERAAFVEGLLGAHRRVIEVVKYNGDWLASWYEVQIDHTALEQEIKDERERERLREEAKAYARPRAEGGSMGGCNF